MRASRLQLTVLALLLGGLRAFAAAPVNDAGTWQHLLEAQLRAESNYATKLTTRADVAEGRVLISMGQKRRLHNRVYRD